MSTSIFRAFLRRKLLDAYAKARNSSIRYKQSIKQERRLEEEPVKFSTSKAAGWNARFTREDVTDNSPWFQPLSVFSSVAIFLLYFCVFREENDIDSELHKTLYDRMPGLERKQLSIALDYNESQGLDTTAIRNRIEELDNTMIPGVEK